MATASRDELIRLIGDYIREQFLDGADASELTPESPLLEWGILNSMNTAMLLAYIRTELGVTVPPTHITGRHFRDLNAIADMVREVSPQPA